MCVRCLILLGVIETITCKTNYQDGDSKRQSSTNISCLYSEFKTITCTWSLKEYYKNDYNNPLDIRESVHIHYTFNVSTSQYCNRDNLVYLQCVCLHSGKTKCSWSHKRSQASESLSLLVAVHDSVTSKLLSSRSEQFDLLDIVKPSPVNNLAVASSTEDGYLLVKWDLFQSYIDYVCEITTISYYQNMTTRYVYFHEQPIPDFPMTCNMHPYEVTLFDVRCRVMFMQTERGFWSKVSVLSIKSDSTVHNSDSATCSLLVVEGIRWCLFVTCVTCVTLVWMHILRNLRWRNTIDKTDTVSEENARRMRRRRKPTVHFAATKIDNTDKNAIRMRRGLNKSPNYSFFYNDQSAIQMRRELIRSRYTTLIYKVGKLLDENILPTNKDIQALNQFCGRQSEGMKTLCEQICGVLKRKMYKGTATNIWPAWNRNSDKIVFVVESTKITNSSSTSHQTDLEIIENKGNCSAFEKESHMVMEKEKELLANQTYDDIGCLQSLQNKVSTYSKELMDKHRNITAIFPSIVKSVGYLGSGKHRLIERLCISIRVEKKISGLIPQAEESIATNVGRFPTDVIEGDFRFFGGGPNDFHENVKIGSAIHAGLVTDKGELLGGTMGCFVKHKSFGLCCMASAHIILSQAEIKEVLKDGYCEYDKHSLKPVYQPIDNRLKQFGQVVSAACNEGHSNMAGVEVALIQIVRRKPKSGSFPITDANKEHTFAFNTGNVADVKLLRPLTEVFKFGIETGPTFGLLGIPGASVRYRGGFRLQNQVVIMPKKDATFAEKGDSGSSAFIGVSCPGTEAAIGLVTGGFDSGQVLVTPIHAALSAVQCPPCLYRFEDVDGDSGFNDDIAEGCESMECN